MKFWETITVRQMGSLLVDFKQANENGEWDKIIKNLDTINAREYRRTPTGKIGNKPKFAGAYFLTAVAAVCEKYGDDRELTVDLLEDTYHLKEIFTPPGKQYDDYLAFHLSAIAVDRDYKKVKCSRCIENIRALLDTPDGDAINCNTPLETLLAWIKDSNQNAFKKGKEENLTDSIESFRQVLNDWDETCKTLCEPSKSAGPSIENNKYFKKICDLLENGVKQIILTGAPGTGKTYLAREVAEKLGADGSVRPVLFHTSYDYTDFVEGLRPVEGKDKGTVFVKQDGHFKAFCRRVVKLNKEDENAKEKKYFFLIDEINRADLSKVFGELMFCLEPDKRGRKNAVLTQYQNLPTYGQEDDVFAEGFYVPENVYIIGTMNDIDRSVESMDFALRRRFTWLEVEVRTNLLAEAFQSGNFGELLKREAGEAADRIGKLNDVIYYVPGKREPVPEANTGRKFGLNQQYYISQGQFSGLPERDSLDDLLKCAWENRIESLLREYVRGEDPERVETFLDACRKQLLPEAKGQPKGNK